MHQAPREGSRAAGARRSRKRARTRAGIFRAAMALFAERGFAAVTVEQICAAADVARGTFFLHFPTKGALLREWSRALAGELAERLRADRGSSLSQLRTLVEQLGEQWRQRPEAARALLGERHGAAGDSGAAAGAGEVELAAVVRAVVRRGQERGELRRNVSPEVASAVLLAACAAVFADAPYGESPVAPAQVRDELLHALLHGLHEPKPRIPWRPS